MRSFQSRAKLSSSLCPVLLALPLSASSASCLRFQISRAQRPRGQIRIGFTWLCAGLGRCCKRFLTSKVRRLRIREEDADIPVPVPPVGPGLAGGLGALVWAPWNTLELGLQLRPLLRILTALARRSERPCRGGGWAKAGSQASCFRCTSQNRHRDVEKGFRGYAGLGLELQTLQLLALHLHEPQESQSLDVCQKE